MADLPKMTAQQMLALVFGQYDIWTENQFTWTTPGAVAKEIYRNKSAVPVLVSINMNAAAVGNYIKLKLDNQEGHKWLLLGSTGVHSFILRPGQTVWGIAAAGMEVYVSISSGLPLAEGVKK